MTKLVMSGENIGVAKQVMGHRVKVIPHPQFKELWQFKFFGEIWIASDYSFVDGSTIE